MKIDVYKMRAWKKGLLIYEFNFEFKDIGYYKIKSMLRSFGYRVEEGFAWS